MTRLRLCLSVEDIIYWAERVAERHEQRRALNGCTIVQVKRNGVSFDDKPVFPLKRHIYCIKKEAVMNSMAGTVECVSSGHPLSSPT